MIVGALMTVLFQVPDTGPDANAFAAIVKNPVDVQLKLIIAYGQRVPVLFIDHLYTDENGIYAYRDPADIIAALRSSGHIGRVVFGWDEPYWRARNSGQNPEEVRMVMEMAQADFPTIEFLIVYSYAELLERYLQDPTELNLYFGVDHVGLDCYGPFSGCGENPVPINVYLEELYKIMQAKGSNAKLFLVPGAFVADMPGMQTEEEVVQHIDSYVNWAKANREKISGFGAFTWNDFDGVTGAGSLPKVKNKLLWAFKEISNLSND